MYRRSAAVVLIALLVASAILVVTPALGHGSSPSGAASSEARSTSQPAASITYQILNGYGNPDLFFVPGAPPDGLLYFIVYDTVDTQVTVTITDPNAALDNVSTPAFKYTAALNTTTGSFNSYKAGVGYAFPTTIVYGGPWTVTFAGTLGGTVSQNVTLFTYYASTYTSVGYGSTLPGEPFTLYWSLLQDANGATFYTHATSVRLTGTYEANGLLTQFFALGSIPLTGASAGIGSWNGTVPANATADSPISFELYAVTNLSGHIVENESSYADVDVGGLILSSAALFPAPPTCGGPQDHSFPTGSLIAGCVEVGSNFGGTVTPISGLPISVKYWDGTAHIVPSGAPTSLTSNAAGEASFAFPGTSPPFVQNFQYPAEDAVNFSVTDAGATPSSLWTVYFNYTFTLLGGSTGSGVVQVSLDQTNYYVGDTATATWSIGTSNLTQTGPVTAVSYTVYGGDGRVFAQGALNHSLSSGTIPIPVTSKMATGGAYFYIYVFAANATATFSGYAYADVLTSTLSLVPSSGYYSAGSTASATVTLTGGGAGATIQYTVEAYYPAEATIASGTVANGSSISVPVPSTNPPKELAFDAWATVGGQVIASAGAEVDLAYGYTVVLGVSTPSSYSDGSYQPGQSITLTYQVISYGGAPLPKTVSFELFGVGYPFFQVIQNVGPSGSLSYTIPSNAVQGTLFVELEAYGSLQNCLTECFGIASLFINPSPSVFGLELGAGSALTVGWLILLVLLVVVAVALFLVFRRRGGRRPSAATMNPPAPAPTTEPPAEWQAPPPPPSAEPASGTGSSEAPPLPQPPGGSP